MVYNISYYSNVTFDRFAKSYFHVTKSCLFVVLNCNYINHYVVGPVEL